MLRGGAFAEKCAVDENLVFPLPKQLSFAQGAGFSITYCTSYHALKQSADLQAGETLLVLGAAGGVGTTAIEIGKAMGARVIAAASSDEKLAFAKSVGADETINYSETALNDAVKELTDGTGADVVYDPVGGDLAQLALRATAWHGRYLVVGFASVEITRFPANLALLKEASIIGVWWGTWSAKNPHEQLKNVQEMAGMIADGRLNPIVTESFSLDQFKQAFRTISERRVMGKVVFKMA
jgi:NADPH2:quinone reductase